MDKNDIPPDDQGINTEYILEISEKIIRRAWNEVSNDGKAISLDDLEKIVKITDSAYTLAIRALEIGYNLTQDYLEDLKEDGDDEDFFEEDGFN